jgi:PEP-CTERM motif
MNDSGPGILNIAAGTLSSLFATAMAEKVPEPGAWLLLGLGLMGVAMGRIVILRREHG